jgi:hypothetical protein
VSERLLPEVSEQEAGGRVAETYAEIRALLGVPVVNLIYRHLAAEPGRLEATWAALRPNLADPATHGLALELARDVDGTRPPVAVVEAAALAQAGVSASEHRRALATLAVYERANALNLLAVSALLEGAPGSPEAVSAARSEGGSRAGAILPMADLDALAARERAILDELSASVAGAGGDTLIPSLYRHLASSPALLRLVWETVGPALGATETARAAGLVRERAALLANRLPCSVDAIRNADLRAVLERFAPAMATMLVSGRMISEALAGAISPKEGPARRPSSRRRPEAPRR